MRIWYQRYPLCFHPYVICIRLGSEPDPIIHKQVMNTYLPGTEIIDLKYMLLDVVSRPDLIRFETNKYMN